MKLCFSTLTCPTWDLERVVEAAREYQLEGIDFRGLKSEIDITRLGEFGAGIDATMELFRRNKLAMPCLNTSITLVAPAVERWQMMLGECRRCARLATRTGTQFLRVFGGQAPKGLSRDEARGMAQRHLRQLIKICHGTGCQVLLETHDQWATSEQVLEMIHEFDPAEVGVLWDLEHPVRRGESPAVTARALARFIRHVHVKDTLPTDGKSRQMLLGEGDLPLHDCLRELRGIGYDGWLCLETEKRWQAEAPEPEQSLPHFVNFMREAWTAIGARENTIAGAAASASAQ